MHCTMENPGTLNYVLTHFLIIKIKNIDWYHLQNNEKLTSWLGQRQVFKTSFDFTLNADSLRENSFVYVAFTGEVRVQLFSGQRHPSHLNQHSLKSTFQEVVICHGFTEVSFAWWFQLLHSHTSPAYPCNLVESASGIITPFFFFWPEYKIVIH